MVVVVGVKKVLILYVYYNLFFLFGILGVIMFIVLLSKVWSGKNRIFV